MTGVTVATGSRLHFGLLCGAPDSGWHYGGVGLMVDAPAWRLEVSLAASGTDEFMTSAAVRERLTVLLSKFRSTFSELPPVRFAATSETAFHTGLGSGTQLTLAAGTALLLLSGHPRPRSISEFATAMGRRRRSAIGTFGFDHGGFLIDHGKSANGQDQPLERLRFPEAWRMLILTPTESTGLSGDTEEQFFTRRRYLDAQTLQQLDQLIQQQIIPAVRDQNFPVFRKALADYGGLVGQYYAAAQGGIFSSRLMQHLIQELDQKNGCGAVQSSWGPSVCVPADSDDHAAEFVSRISALGHASRINVTVARGLNSGALIRSSAPEHHRSFG
ncbi:MAG: hypothetical protein RIK87_14895 [Fuerstiella sp.]